MNPQDRPPYTESLRLANFTCFHRETLELVSGVNVFAGPNGSGKTHALKAIYAFRRANSPGRRPTFYDELKSLFQTSDLDDLRRKTSPFDSLVEVSGSHDHEPWHFGIKEGSGQPVRPGSHKNSEQSYPVFLPAMDMIGHSKGFLEASNLVELDFDSSCRDLLTYLGSKSKAQQNGRTELLSKLNEVAIGDIEQDDSKRYYLVNEKGRFPMPMVAEGIRKVVTLKRLVENNWITPGSSLFWDEPEVNLSPQIMDEVSQAILMIARSGVQVFLASHSYLILKELEVNKRDGDSLRYFAFDETDSGTVVRPSDDYLGLSPNPIEAQYADLYDRQIKREIDAIESGVVREEV